MTTHKAIRDAAEEGPYYTAMVAKPDLRALLADLDAKTAEVERLQELVRNAPEFFAPQHDFYGRKLQWIVEADTALEGTP